MDRAIRELERRWEASGAIDDEVALFAARQRFGDRSGVSEERGALLEWLLRLAAGHRSAEAARGALSTLTGRDWTLVDRRGWSRTGKAGRATLRLRAPSPPLELPYARRTCPERGSLELVAAPALGGRPLRAVEAKLVSNMTNGGWRREAVLSWEGGVSCAALLEALRGGAPVTCERVATPDGGERLVVHVADVRDHEAMDRFVFDRTDLWVGIDPAARRAAFLTVHDRDSSA